MIRLLIVDDQRLVRAGVRMLCESTTDVEVVGEGSDGSEAVRLTAELRPDVVLMDLRMPGLDGTAATAQITASCPDSKVLSSALVPPLQAEGPQRGIVDRTGSDCPAPPPRSFLARHRRPD